MCEFFLGIDIGGTKTRIGVIARGDPARVTASVTQPTNKDDPAASVLETVHAAMALLPGDGRFLAAGICAPGPLDLRGRRPGFLPNLPAWKDYPLGDAFEHRLGVPVVLEHDAKAAAYGELSFGSGRGFSDFIFVTLGTGIGGALVSGHEVIRGMSDGAGEIGHIQVDPDGPVCGCGRRGCLEAVASGPAIERAYGKPAGEAFAAARRGDTRAREVLAGAGRALGAGLATAITLLEPQAVVLGGGLSQVERESFRFYLDPCRDEVCRSAYRMWGQDIPMLVAELGSEGPLLGAALLAREGWENAVQQQLQREPQREPQRELQRELQQHRVDKPWGEEVWWAQTERYVGKRIFVRAGQSLSLQYHVRKLETMYFACGQGVLLLGDSRIDIVPGLSVTIQPGMRHRVMASTDLTFFEVSTPEVDDVVRLEDRYGRA